MRLFSSLLVIYIALLLATVLGGPDGNDRPVLSNEGDVNHGIAESPKPQLGTAPIITCPKGFKKDARGKCVPPF